MTKAKSKPVAKSDIRERVERKFRARGALVFHLLLVLGGGIFFLYFNFWDFAPDFSSLSLRFFYLQMSLALYAPLSVSGALHFIHYYYKYGRGRAKHEAETEAWLARQLPPAAADEVEEQEELIRLQTCNKLKSRRLAWQHLAIYSGIMAYIFFEKLVWSFNPWRPPAWSYWQEFINIAVIWGIGLAAHFLRTYFASGKFEAKRQAKIEAEVAQELGRRVARLRSKADSDRAAAYSEEENRAQNAYSS